MKYLCLIYIDEQELGAIREPEISALNAEHLEVNRRLHAEGRFIEAEALAPARDSATVRVRNGKTIVMDGPFTEAKEMVAGFYLIEAADLAEATAIAARIPAARTWTVEVRPTRQLVVDGRSMPALSLET
jgi:hypothetical protein